MQTDQSGNEDSQVEMTEDRLHDDGRAYGAADRQDISIAHGGQGHEAEIRQEVQGDVSRDALLLRGRPPHGQMECARGKGVHQPVKAAPRIPHEEIDTEGRAECVHGHGFFAEDSEQDRDCRVEQKQRQQHQGHPAQPDRGNDLPQPQGPQGWQSEKP